MLRAYEKPLLAIVLLLVLALAALLVGPLVASGSSGERRANEGASAGKSHHDTETVQQAADVKREPRPDLLCSDGRDLQYLVNEGGTLGIAVDRSGHFTFYGAPDPASGRPTDDSYSVLRDCADGLSFYNYASVLVQGHPAEPAGAGALVQSTERSGSDALSTAFHFDGGVELRQLVELKQNELRISYMLVNTSEERRTVALRSLMTPAMGRSCWRV